MENKLPQFAVSYIRGHEVMGKFMESVINAITYDRETWNILKGRVVPVHCPHYFNIGRNQQVEKFLKLYGGECEVMVSLDTDQVFTPPQLMHLVSLVNDDRPVVSGRYFACDDLGQQIRPVVMDRKPDGRLVSRWNLPEDELVTCDVVGMGFCAIQTKLLREMQDLAGPTWFDFDYTEQKNEFMPEDNAFCLRVQEFMGKEIYVHTGITVGHLKLCEVREERKGGEHKEAKEQSHEIKC